MKTDITRKEMKEIVRQAYENNSLMTRADVLGERINIDHRCLDDGLKNIREVLHFNTPTSSTNSEALDTTEPGVLFIRDFFGYIHFKKRQEQEWLGYLRLKNRLISEQEMKEKEAQKNISGYFESTQNEKEYPAIFEK